jgi:pyruvate kinase
MAFTAVTLSNSLAVNSKRLPVGIVVDVPYTANMLRLPSSLPEHLSHFRPNVPIFVLVPTYKAGRMLQILYGVHPILAPNQMNATALSQLLAQVIPESEGKTAVYIGKRGGNVKDDLSIDLLQL